MEIATTSTAAASTHRLIRSEFNFEMSVVLTQPKPSLHILTHDRHDDVVSSKAQCTRWPVSVRRWRQIQIFFLIAQTKTPSTTKRKTLESRQNKPIFHSLKSHDFFFSWTEKIFAAQTNREQYLKLLTEEKYFCIVLSVVAVAAILYFFSAFSI